MSLSASPTPTPAPSTAAPGSVPSQAFDSSKAVAALKHIDVRAYADWTTAPLGRVAKERLSGKVALVTGASAGIGAVSARRLAAEGAKVILFARREDKLAAIVNAIKKSGGEATYFVGDATKEEDNKKVVAFALKTYGGLHITFNNAGIVRGFGQKPWEVPAEVFNDQMNTNVSSVFFGIKHQAPAISSSGGGVILSNASVVAFSTGIPAFGIYPASKSWVVGYSQHVAGDLAKIGVRINTVSPGPTISDIFGTHQAIEEFGVNSTAIGRPLKTEEIASAVAYLGSDEALSITGIDLIIDGGVRVVDKK